MKTRRIAFAILAVSLAASHAQTLPGFTFNSADNSYTYDDRWLHAPRGLG